MSDLSGRDLQQFYEDRYVEGYMEDWPESKKRRVADLVKSLGLPDTGRVLDFGCGQGVFTHVLLQALPGWVVYGAELSDVAIGLAAKRLPDCVFLKGDALDEAGPFDLVFTHHVLEHVQNIDDVLAQMAHVAAPGARMLHILPCGNAGSLEHRLSMWHANGIQAEAGNRFFFEDAGHLRRLTSEDLIRAAGRHNWQIRSQRFSNQFWGAIDWITDADSGFIRGLTQPSTARGMRAAASLLGWRIILTAACLAKRVPSVPLGRILKRQAETEWQRQSHNRSGSEMYLLFEKA